MASAPFSPVILDRPIKGLINGDPARAASNA
jgi:hypothetical protein